MTDEPSRRSAIDLSGGQTGEIKTGDSAGGNIIRGLEGDDVVRLLEGARNASDAMVVALDRVWARLDQMERDAHKAERDAALERGIDYEARHKRQAALDARLDDLDRRLAWLAAALLLCAAVVAWLIWREVAALAARAAFDALALSR